MKVWIAYNNYDGFSLLFVTINEKKFKDWAVKQVRENFKDLLEMHELSCDSWDDVSHILWGGNYDVYSDDGYFDYDTYVLNPEDCMELNLDFEGCRRIVHGLVSGNRTRWTVKDEFGVTLLANPTFKQVFDYLEFDVAKLKGSK